MDLSTRYLGLSLKNPIVASASPLSHTLDGIKQLEDNGAAAVVMYSLFEEQTGRRLSLADQYQASEFEDYLELLRCFPNMSDYAVTAEDYVGAIRAAKAAVDIPIIASLNVTSPGEWSEYAQWIEKAGADALEINVYFVPARSRSTSAQVENRIKDVLNITKGQVKIPVAIKLSPFLSAPADTARALSELGADGLVLFNRFYQPDIDIETMKIVPRLTLSTSDELRLPLRWAALLYRHIHADIAISTGVHTSTDVLKGLMAGAKVTMMASELLAHGPERIKVILKEIKTWLEKHGHNDLRAISGVMSQMGITQVEAFERGSYIKTLASWKAESKTTKKRKTQ